MEETEMADTGLHISFAQKFGDIGAETMRNIRLAWPRNIVVLTFDCK